MRNIPFSMFWALAILLVLISAVLVPPSHAGPDGVEKVIFTVW
jgi:hypothetical protein